MSIPGPFNPPLGPDPAVALKPPNVPPQRPGPAHAVQFVIEAVGPRSVPTTSVKRLLDTDWHPALGYPESHVMAPSETTWQPLKLETANSVDSIALSWDLVSPAGQLSAQSATHLLDLTEQFGKAIGRRAMPMPIVADIAKVSDRLTKSRDELDIGVSLIVLSQYGGFREKDLWVQCARLGLEMSPEASFDWKSPNHPSPLFSVTPIGVTEAFSLAAVQNDAAHDGVTVGFSVPMCPVPVEGLEGAFRAVDVIAESLGGIAVDDLSRKLDNRVRDELRKELASGVALLEQIGLKPGSIASAKLFGT